MDKATGVPLSQVWDALNLSQKLQVLLVMTRLQKQWLRVSFSHYGSLYYAGDVQSPKGNHYIKDGKIVMNSEFAIGPATGRDWMDAGRSALRIQKGPWGLCGTVSARCPNARDSSIIIPETSKAVDHVVWPKTVSARYRKETYLFGMVSTNH